MLVKHLIQPEVTNSTCRPFVKNKERIRKFKETERSMIYLSK